MPLSLDIRKAISVGILFAFLANTFGPLPCAQAQDLSLPAPGGMVRVSPPFAPPILKGIKVHPDNPFRFDFILDRGDESNLHPEQLKIEATKLIKYFLASLTIPEKDLWVNLSPYEKDRIIPKSFGLTEMGRDLLAEDYMLKQITASLIYPEDAIGKKFWKRIYEEASKRFGTTNIPVNTFNKVWIVPEKAVVYENVKSGTAYVVESKLKVMLEQDYLSMSKHANVGETGRPNVNRMGSQIVREIVIPELTKEVNEDKNFSPLRQVYNSLILAAWYKKKIKDSLLAQVYADKKKVAGVGYGPSRNDIEAIYQRYLQAFKKGAYNYIKEEQDPITQETIPRKYFSGGIIFDTAMISHGTNMKADILSIVFKVKKNFMGGLRNKTIILAQINPFIGATVPGAFQDPRIRKLVKQTFSPQEQEYYTPGLVKLVQAAGESADYLIEKGMPAVRQLFTEEEFKSYWPDLVKLGVAAGGKSDFLFIYGLPALKKLLTDEEFSSYWPDLVELGQGVGENSMYALEYGLQATKELIHSREDLVRWGAKLKRLNKSVSKYNAEAVFKLLKSSGIIDFIQSKQEGELEAWFDFFIDIFEENKRLGLQIWEGVFETIKAGQVPIELTTELKEKIRAFIGQTNGFNQSLWVLYQREGYGGLAKVKQLAELALEDELSPEQIGAAQEDWQKRGYSSQGLTLGMVQMAVPASGASYVKREDLIDLWQHMSETGDLRSHVPEAIRGIYVGEQKDTKQIEYVLGPGVVFDENKELQNLISALVYPDAMLSEEQKAERVEQDKGKFVNALRAYLQNRTQENRDKVMPAFYQWVRHTNFSKEKVEKIIPREYRGLAILEQLFSDKNALPNQFKKVYKEVKRKGREGTKEISYAQGLKDIVQAVWEKRGLPLERKIKALDSILNPYNEQSVRNSLLPLITDERLRSAIEELISSEGAAQLEGAELIKELFEDPLNVIRQEKGKFTPIVKEGKIKLRFKAGKGPGWQLWGEQAGVCTGPDMVLWKNKNFYLLGMIDKAKDQTVGFIEMYEQVIDGQRILTVPGIQPSTEFLGQVDVKEIYPLIEEALREVAKKVGYKAVYLPTSTWVLSNRSEIRELVVKRGYRKLVLAREIQWNTIPQPHPFDEVYELPLTDHAMNTEGTQESLRSSTGGIDLTPASMNLQTQTNSSSGTGINFHIDPAMLAQLQNAPGFVPQIIDIQPMTDLSQFLGVPSA